MTESTVTMWGIHNGDPSLDLLDGGFISIGWEHVGDLTQIPADREALKMAISGAYPNAKPGAIPVWAGVIFRFMAEIQLGDLVVSPKKDDRTLNFGVVTSDFYVDSVATSHRNRRRVEWTKVGVPRDQFSQAALHEIGSAVTLFKVSNHLDEFLRYLEDGLIEKRPSADEDDNFAADEPSAERVDTYSRDFVIDVLKQMDPYRFEHFVAGLLRATGYRASATVGSGDGGIDVIASRDVLGIEPPIIKVQCKRMTSTIGGPEVQKLAGALAHGGTELGVFVALGAYSADAIGIERTRQDIRLINGTQLVDLIFEFYDKLDAEWKRLLPLRTVLAVDRDS